MADTAFLTHQAAAATARAAASSINSSSSNFIARVAALQAVIVLVSSQLMQGQRCGLTYSQLLCHASAPARRQRLSQPDSLLLAPAALALVAVLLNCNRSNRRTVAVFWCWELIFLQ
jgi:hypothetical protein